MLRRVSIASLLLLAGCSGTVEGTVGSDTTELASAQVSTTNSGDGGDGSDATATGDGTAGSESTATGDSSGQPSAADSDTPVSEATTSEPTGSATTVSIPPGSTQAAEFKELAPRLAGLGDGVARFAGLTPDGRVDQLAARACQGTAADQSDDQLRQDAVAAYQELSVEEQADITPQDWIIFNGALIGFFCPEQLPLVDLESVPPADGSPIEQFKAVITQLDGVTSEAEAFTEALEDERIDELQGGACAATSSEMTTEDFGLAIVTSYQGTLTEPERRSLSLSGFSQLYGAMVGWFCPANLPL